MTIHLSHYYDASIESTMISDINRDNTNAFELIAFDSLPEAKELREAITELAKDDDLRIDYQQNVGEENLYFYDIWLDGLKNRKAYEFTLEIQYCCGLRYSVKRMAIYEGVGVGYYQFTPALTYEDKKFDCQEDPGYIEIYT